MMHSLKALTLLILTLTIFFSCQESTVKKSESEREQTYSHNYELALDFRDKERFDSAYVYFSRAKDDFLQIKDSIGIAKSLINMSVIAQKLGDYFGSQEIAASVTDYLDSTKQNQRELISSNYNTLGVVAGDLQNYDEAINFLKKAISLTKDKKFINLYNNNIGIDLMFFKKYDEGIIHLEKASKDSTSEYYAMSLSNLAKLKSLKSENYNPLPLFHKALRIKINNSDLWGQNVSFAYLSDYYSANGNIDSALFYAKAMYKVAKKLNSANDQIEALEKLVTLTDGKETKTNFYTLKKFGDSARTARSNAKNQFALIRYDVEKHKADNLVLQKENSEKNYQIALIITASAMLGIGGLFWYRKRKQRLALEADKKIQENRLQTSKKVHDVVANGLYRVMTEIENVNELDREQLLDKIDDMYKKSRDISYNEPIVDTTPSSFHEQLAKMVHSFRSSKVAIKLTGNNDFFWNNVSATTKSEIEQVLQELMVNMKKHSQASHVILNFNRTASQAIITYQDNGIGLPKDVHFNNGLTSTGTRIQNISGTITFESIDQNGLEILISFPI